MEINSQQRPKKKDAWEQIRIVRINLLLMTIFTAVNIIMYFVGNNTMFLFSATIPYISSMLGEITENPSLTAPGLVVAFAVLALYLLCWLLSKKRPAWLTVALCLFSIDSITLIALLILTRDVSGIIDVALHAWVLYYLVIGVIYSRQIKKLGIEGEAESEFVEPLEQLEREAPQVLYPETTLRLADTSVKARILIQGNYANHNICYRRVKRVNELVIDGYIYDEVEMLAEVPHKLSGTVDGYKIAVGYDGINSYISVNGQRVAKKLRLI